jgi:hypothetical protein
VHRRILDTVERLVWLVVASMIAGTWVGWEPITGHKIPDYAHPVFATILAAALVWGGLDMRKVSAWHKRLLALPPEAAVSVDEADRLAPRIAALETEDPILVRAIQAAALREANLPIKRTKTGKVRPVSRPRNRKTPAPVDPRDGG